MKYIIFINLLVAVLFFDIILVELVVDEGQTVKNQVRVAPTIQMKGIF